jgi:hypothetical protein
MEDGDAPQVIFSDSSTGNYDLVVGADGDHLTIRGLSLGVPQRVSSARRLGASSSTAFPRPPIGW